MKKWQKITGISLAIVMIIAAAGFMVYRFYIVPKYMDPLIKKFSVYIQDDQVLDSLYASAADLHDSGVLSDSIYTKFVTAYNKRNRDDIEYAHNILDGDSADASDSSSTTSSLSAKYASNKVGIEIIQTNDEGSGGKSTSTYSSSRTSERTRAEDRLEAEKILDEAAADATEKPELDEEAAYKRLKDNMTSSEYSTLISVMAKLDKNVLKSFLNNKDKEGLKEYLHSKLNNDEYKKIVNLGYKYAYLFIND